MPQSRKSFERKGGDGGGSTHWKGAAFPHSKRRSRRSDPATRIPIWTSLVDSPRSCHPESRWPLSERRICGGTIRPSARTSELQILRPIPAQDDRIVTLCRRKAGRKVTAEDPTTQRACRGYLLVFGRSFDMVDNKNLHSSLLLYQPKAKLLLKRCLERRPG